MDDHRDSTTVTEIMGTAHGDVYRNALHLYFKMDALPCNPLIHVHMWEAKHLQAGGLTMVERDTSAKAGVIRAIIADLFRRVP